METPIYKAFETYRKTVFSVSCDTRRWLPFLKWKLSEFVANRDPKYYVFSSVYHAYNIDPLNGDGFGKMDIENAETLYPNELEDNLTLFYRWMLGHGIVRIYAALEMLLLQAIQLTYFPSMECPSKNKKAASKIVAAIKDSLKSQGIKSNGVNNKYLIDYLLTHQNNRLEAFFKQKVRVNFRVNWMDFFRFVGVIRNTVSHNGMVISNDAINELNSIDPVFFSTYFHLEKGDGETFLWPVISDTFDEYNAFVQFVNDFTCNTVKFICGENDLTFLGLR